MRKDVSLAGRACLIVFLVISLGCVPGRGGWESSAWPPPETGVPASSLGRITDLLPEFRPDPEGLSLFLCRWSKQEPIPVHWPSDALPRERRLWHRALKAWESAGLGISFIEAEKPLSHGIEVVFRSEHQSRPKGTGDALADCRMASAFEGASPLEAHLSWASIHLNRSLPSWKGVEIALEEDQLLGAMLHELGHALGFSGHVVSGDSIMVADRAKVRAIARGVARGKSLPAPELVALYAVPSGLRVGHRPLEPAQRRLFSSLTAKAESLSWLGPFSRVGDVRALFFYRDEQGRRHGLQIENWALMLRKRVPPVLISVP